MGRLLVSVRGPNEALAAAEGGAHIIDVEYPSSALGTPYPLNIKAVRDALDASGHEAIPISTNIGEQQPVRSMACQAALGVAIAGGDYVKCGLAGLDLRAAIYLGRSLVRTIREWLPDKKIYPAIFPEKEFATLLDPLVDGPRLVEEIDSDGLLIDTFHKSIDMGIKDYYSEKQIQSFASRMQLMQKEAWIAGSITKDQLPSLWLTEVDVICVRAAACKGGADRFGRVSQSVVTELAKTMH